MLNKISFHTHVIQFKSLLAMELVGMTTSNIDNYKDQISRGTDNPQGSNCNMFSFFPIYHPKKIM